MKTFPARFPGLCIPCGDAIEQGDEITHHEVCGFVHVHCVELANEEVPSLPRDRREPGIRTNRVMPPGKTAKDRCGRCFIVHTPGQGDDCE